MAVRAINAPILPSLPCPRHQGSSDHWPWLWLSTPPLIHTEQFITAVPLSSVLPSPHPAFLILEQLR